MRRLWALTALLVVLAACAAPPPPAPSVEVVLVRHAEKADDGTRDPPLTEAGRARAAALAERLAGERLVAVYATEFRRTQETARPAAEAAGLDVTLEPVGSDGIDAFTDRMAARLRSHVAAGGGTVLVVGHSNTIPALAAALTGVPVDPMPETEYDRVMTARLTADGGRLTTSRLAVPSAPR
jgi:broad specificity phosphatase PhoE